MGRRKQRVVKIVVRSVKGKVGRWVRECTFLPDQYDANFALRAAASVSNTHLHLALEQCISKDGANEAISYIEAIDSTAVSDSRRQTGMRSH